MSEQADEQIEGGESTKRLRAVDRFKQVPGRTKLFIALGLLLVVLAVTGGLQAGSDVSIEREEAIEIARKEIDFEPLKEDARLVRQGFSMVPVWAVSFSIPKAETTREFERLTTVEINAETGTIIRVSVDNLDESAP